MTKLLLLVTLAVVGLVCLAECRPQHDDDVSTPAPPVVHENHDHENHVHDEDNHEGHTPDDDEEDHTHQPVSCPPDPPCICNGVEQERPPPHHDSSEEDSSEEDSSEEHDRSDDDDVGTGPGPRHRIKGKGGKGGKGGGKGKGGCKKHHGCRPPPPCVCPTTEIAPSE